MSDSPAPASPAPIASKSTRARPPPLIGWRVLALVYDFWPALALWMLASLVFTLGYTIAGHDPHQNIRALSAMQLALWAVCWLLTGLYAVLSWRKGGQTLGMRPWRLRVVSIHADAPSWRALTLRYAVATVSLLLAGVGFWWTWFDRDRLTWHDRASGTRIVRKPKA